MWRAGGELYFCASSMKLFQADSTISWLEEEGAGAFGTRHGKHVMERSFWRSIFVASYPSPKVRWLAVLLLSPQEYFAVAYQV